VTTKKRRNFHDRLGQQRRGDLNERLSEISLTATTIQEVENRFKVPSAKEPDGKFATTIAAWARGRRSVPCWTSPTSKSAKPRREIS